MAFLAVIDKATAASHTILTGATGKRFRILALHMSAAGAVTVTVKHGSTAFTGAMSMVAGVPHTLPATNSFDPLPYFEVPEGEDFVLTLGGAVQVSGFVLYDEVKG